MCYDAFKAAHGAKAQLILSNYRMQQSLLNASGKTVGKRKGEFNRLCKEIIELVSNSSSLYLSSHFLLSLSRLIHMTPLSVLAELWH